MQTIVFARARLTTEILLGYVRDTLAASQPRAGLVRGYRGGYLPLERRDIEKGLRDGQIRGVVATNALELGIDIGSLSAAILAGYPGTIASTWQQIGRAGRRIETSVGVLVASSAPLDQYIMAHPRYLFEHSPEHALINPDNLAILVNHLRCAVFELPFQPGEAFGEFKDAADVLSLLAEEGQVHASDSGYRWVAGNYPAASISLRTSGSSTIVIQDQSGAEPRVIGEVDRESAPIMVYDGAVYLHEGTQYLIEHLDWENGLAQARRADVDYYTSASSGTDIQVEEEFETAVAGDCVKTHGRVQVTVQASSYRMVRRYTHETLGYGQIDLPAQQFETTAYWLSLTPDLTSQLEEASILLRPNNYGPNWQEQRNKARARDGYRCTRCGAPEKDERQHDIHHLRPFRDFGYAPGLNEAYQEANELNNLTTLCHNCHREVEAATGTRSALSGLGNILRNLAAFMLMCSPNDIGLTAEHRSPYTHTPTITLYDQAPGGLGFSARLYELHDQLLSRALELVTDCPCSDGCPACVGPLGEVGGDTKSLTTALLKAMVNTQSQAD
jgi:DEAD/DEAH box helicase domain-containing protein